MGTNTGLGIGIGIPFKNNALGGDKPYFPPELKARMIGVWTNYGKKNTDADRNIIKNKIPNAGGDLEILNAAYKLNSGFGEYSEDFTTWTKSSKITSVDSESFDFVTNATWNLLYYKSNIGKDIPSFKVRIKLKGEGKVFYNYITSEGVYTNEAITSEEYVTPISYNTKYTGETPVNCGFTIGITSEEGSGTITQIPNFEDAFVSDGINDIIASIKTLEEWNIGNKGITIVSMIHQINTNTDNFITTNNIRTDNKVIGRNIVSNIEKTGIYGWYKENIQSDTINVINNILGDKNDYTSHSSPSTNINSINNSKFYVQGYAVENGFAEISSIAHYWTFAVLGKATEDEINLIIGNYNLDRSLKPDILCNIGKQGITNDNHADFNDKLIDYSGNGRDIQMNNLAWKGGSGIAAKQYETFKDWTNTSYQTSTVTEIDEFTRVVDSTSNAYWVSMINRTSDFDKVHDSINIVLYQDDMLLVHECKYKIDENVTTKALYETLKSGVNTITLATIDKFTDIPEDAEIMSLGEWVNPKSNKGSVKITLLPSYKGGLLLDGVNDFGKVTGMPVYKDYTVVTDREIFANIGAILSKNNPGAFVETAGNSVYSFGQATSRLNFISTRSISYLSKYSYCGQSITAGAAEDGTDMWLGTIRDNDHRFFNGAIYSLMTFPYSMSEFLIERQLKKHKLGTLYPNMVEFRPVIKSSVELVNKPSFAIRGTSTLLNAGDYIPENSEIWVVITMNNAADRITKFVINGNTIDIPSSAYNPSTMKYGFPFTIDNKSPQKITMTIEQDENYVKFEPVITSNVEYVRLDFYLNNYQKRINIGDYIPKDAYLRANLYLKNNVDELTVFTFNGINIGYRRSSVDDTAFNINQIYNYDSPQEVNITVDEYIRYEDIVQPYPVLLRFNDENGNEVSWGGKFRVGSTITRIGSAADSNLLPNIYNIFGLLLNDNQVTSSKVIVEKTMVFKAKSAYIFDNNEPKCILSPRLLRIPNSSYKILGHIPDISGHGNHGKINNSAYAGMSGANGYVENFNEWRVSKDNVVITRTDSKATITKIGINSNTLPFFQKDGSVLINNYVLTVNITGIPEGVKGKFIHNNLFTKELIEGKNTITLQNDAGWYGFTFYNENNAIIGDCNITIEQIGEYEGAYCLDGVDDFVTIPTLSSGGKQVLMKVNQSNVDSCLYTQVSAGIGQDRMTTSLPTSLAYQGKWEITNWDKVYIDGIENNNITNEQLYDITHIITAISRSSVETVSPIIGALRVDNTLATFAKMSLYDFMLFDNVSTDDKIKQLNEYVGIEGNTEWRKTE